jgi:hypothetical protein
MKVIKIVAIALTFFFVENKMKRRGDKSCKVDNSKCKQPKCTSSESCCANANSVLTSASSFGCWSSCDSNCS